MIEFNIELADLILFEISVHYQYFIHLFLKIHFELFLRLICSLQHFEEKVLLNHDLRIFLVFAAFYLSIFNSY